MSDSTTPNEGLQLQSTVHEAGSLEISLVSIPTPKPGPKEIVVRMEAAPINPSDLGLLFGPADIAAAKPTLAMEGGGGALWIAPITLRHLGAAQADLSFGAGG